MDSSVKMQPKLLFMIGSLRANSASKALGAALAERLADDADVSVAEIGNLPLYNADITDNPAVAALIEAVRSSDGVVFITPEYNYSIPGVLKNAIDWVSRPAYQSAFLHKPCFVVSLSGGALGGVRAQGHLKQMLNGMMADVFPSQEVIVTFGNDKVKEGRFSDEPTLDFGALKLRAFCDHLRDNRRRD